MRLEAVDFDPFAEAKPAYRLEAVDGDPFARPPVTIDDGSGPIAAPWQTKMPEVAAQLPVVRPDAGQNIGDGVRLLADSATMGTADKFAAGMGTGFGLAGDYQARLAIERAATAEAVARTGGAGQVVKGAGGALGMAAAASMGLPVFGGAGNVASRFVQGGVSMGGLGAAAGAIRADDGNRAAEALHEGGLQGAVGAAGPVAGRLLSGAWNGLRGAATGYFSPATAALDRVGAAAQRSGVAPAELEARLTAAVADSQPQYLIADALGTEGRGALAVATKAPGPGRDAATQILDQRQAGQARRVTDFIDGGFGTNGRTAAQTEQALIEQRRADAAVNYGAAREGAGAVNVTPVIERADAVLNPGISGVATPRANLPPNSIEAAVSDARSLLTDGSSQVIDFNRVFQAKRNIDGWIGEATRRGNGAVVSQLTPLQAGLDDALSAASQRYAGARDVYANQSRQIGAIDTGRQAAARGRTEDTLQTFGALSPAEQQAFRSGYSDPYITAAQGARVGNNAAAPLTSDAVRTEFPAFAREGQGDALMRRIGRENEMFETRRVATGGSQTAENLANEADASRASLLIRILKEPMSAAGQIAESAFNGARGLTPEVREQMVRMLLSRDARGLSADLASVASSRAQQEAIARALGRGIVGTSVGVARANQ